MPAPELCPVPVWYFVGSVSTAMKQPHDWRALDVLTKKRTERDSGGYRSGVEYQVARFYCTRCRRIEEEAEPVDG